MSTEQPPRVATNHRAHHQAQPVLPKLRVVTKPLGRFPGLTIADAQNPLYWAHEDFELIGAGNTLTLDFVGPERFARAKNVWQELVAQADVIDEVQQSGTGLIAFTSFAFSVTSEHPSLLILPQTLIGRNGDDYWITTMAWIHDEDLTGDVEVTEELVLHETPVLELGAVSYNPSSFSAQEYQEAVAASTRLIEQGTIEKVVLARDLRLNIQGTPDYRRMLEALRTRYRNCWTFAMQGFIGSSPETLLELHRGEFQVQVLAGSAPRGVDQVMDMSHRDALLNSAKNRHEHHFAVDNALESLSEVVETLETDDTFALQLPNLWHLATDIHGQLDEHTSPFDVLEALHPTAAVAGTPTIDALLLIEELEPFDRGRYAGPIGWLSADGDGQWAIALRSAQTEPDGTVTAFAGCGIVEDSKPDEELAETDLKFRPILEALGKVE